MSDLFAALAFLTAEYANPEPPTVAHTVVAAKAARSSKPRARASLANARKAKEEAPIGQRNQDKPTVPGLILPEANTLDAAGFFNAWRKAGMRTTADGKPFFDKGEERNDQIKAIAGFIGWDPKGTFSAQELAAKSEARKKLAPIGQQGEVKVNHSAVTTVVAFVKGMPDHDQKFLQNLLARERVTVETIIDLDKEGKDASEQRKALDHIRTLIAQLAPSEG